MNNCDLLTVTFTVLPFGDGSELLKVEPHHRIGEEASVFLCVPLGNVDEVGFENDGPDLTGTVVESMNGGDRAVVFEAVLAADDAEPGDATVFVEEVESFGGGGGWEAGDDIDVSGAADGHLEAVFDGAAFDEVLVGLWVVEAADDGPDGVWWRVDTLGE